MQINVVKDKSGKTIATFETATGSGPQVAPVLTAGHKVEELDVPENYKSDLKTLYA